MKSITVSSLARYVVANPFLSSLLILMVMITGLVTGSLAIVIASGVLAFGRPVFYCSLYSSKDDSENPRPLNLTGALRLPDRHRSVPWHLIFAEPVLP